MLNAAITLFVLALVAALFGFGGFATSMVGLGKILFGVFLLLAIIGFVMNGMRRAAS